MPFKDYFRRPLSLSDQKVIADVLVGIVVGLFLIAFAIVDFLFPQLGDSVNQAMKRSQFSLSTLLVFMVITAFGFGLNHWDAESKLVEVAGDAGLMLAMAILFAVHHLYTGPYLARSVQKARRRNP